MKQHFTIPPELSHLELDERGYPIPYFVGKINGKFNFKYQDRKKRDSCIQFRWCPICAKRLDKEFSYVITGPRGLKNKVVSDAPMHLLCAEFTLKTCPHIHFEKAERKEEPVAGSYILRDKPSSLYLIKVDTWRLTQGVIMFNPVSAEEYIYENNVLVKKH